MRKAILSMVTLALLAVSYTAGAVALQLLAHNQRSSSGTLSNLKWSGCTTYTAATPCINPGSAVLAGMGITPSTATWDWTGSVLTSVGSFNTASTIGSSGAAAASAVIGDKVVDMVINTNTLTTTATAYNCAEGNFLAGVGANGCLNLNNGGDFVSNSSALYNVGGDANCVQRTIGGDDASTGNPRGLQNSAGGGGCDAVDGAFNLWTVHTDNTATGGNLILSNGLPLGTGSPDPSAAGVNYLTFVVEGAVDDGPVPVDEGIATPIAVVANDSITFTDPVTVTVTTNPTQGSAVVSGSPGPRAGISVAYTGNIGATGTDTFIYEIDDGVNPADTATVTVAFGNAIPVAIDADLSISTAGVAPDAATGTFNPANVPGNSLGNTPSVVTATDGAKGTTTVSSNVVTYTPSATFFTGTDTFDYTITDNDSPTPESDTGTVTVSIADVPPTLGNLSITATSGTASSAITLGTALGNGSLAQHTVVVSTPASNGTCTPSTSATSVRVSYTSAAGYTGPDSCVITITDEDGAGQSGTGTVNITVNAASSGGGGGGGGGSSGAELPGGSGALDAWGLALLGAALLMRRRRVVANLAGDRA